MFDWLIVEILHVDMHIYIYIIYISYRVLSTKFNDTKGVGTVSLLFMSQAKTAPAGNRRSGFDDFTIVPRSQMLMILIQRWDYDPEMIVDDHQHFDLDHVS